MTQFDPSLLPHLAPSAAAVAQLQDDLRIRAVRTERWVGFSRARHVLEHLQSLRDDPPSTRPPGIAVFAHSGMGKTMLVEKFRRNNPPTNHLAHGVESTPVISITLTSRPNERRIYAQLLAALDIGIDQRAATLADLEGRAVRLLKQAGVRVLVFDEIHNLLAGSPREQRVVLQLLRFLSNELKASLVCLGIAEAREAIAGDVQLARRLDQIALPRWKADAEFQALISAVLRSLPLRHPSALSAQSIRHIARVSEGITAKIFSMMNQLAIEAIRNGTDRIIDDAVEAWKPAIEKEAAFA
ncbi:TniB family NTP-binding protein [Methylovirgula sp. 4M-Z18]|uniref:TniB family NTP-binding protein n=1 Tax=Methylovirgula sp. 4M-Z18 TaxID=2293567 RepID=UPI000E2E9B17|nr:TniB family NTP-binding protein [Methylovirgula sp. 4M-Z18]RFB76695.1 AAA family ATPase [Methylovirgula sp. 4M-Z18]